MEPSEALTEVWKGAIPVRITLSMHDITSLESPPPMFLLLPRVSYIPLILEEVIQHFEPHTHTVFKTQEIWFSYNNKVLKWQYPLGVLADSLAGPEIPLPWHLEVNFNRYPVNVLLPYNGLASIRTLFLNSLKESCALMTGSANSVMNMSKQQEDFLWEASKNRDHSAYWNIAKDFLKLKPEQIRYLPVKFLYFEQYEGYVMQPVKALDETGEPYTVGEVVKKLFQQELQVVVQGITIPPETHLFWLWNNMSFPDNFLYVVLSNN